MRQRLLHGVAGAQLRVLLHPDDAGAVEPRPHRLAAVAVNHADAARLQGAGAGEHVREQGLTGQRLQHFGQDGAHTLALTGGKNDDFHGWHFSAKKRLGF